MPWLSKKQTAGHAKRAEQALTSDQEGGAVWAKLVPEGGEEVDELEDLSAGHAASQGAPQRSRQQKQNEIGQESNCLRQYTSPSGFRNALPCNSEFAFKTRSKWTAAQHACRARLLALCIQESSLQHRYQSA